MFTIVSSSSGYQLLYISNGFRFNSNSNFFMSKIKVLHNLKSIQNIV